MDWKFYGHLNDFGFQNIRFLPHRQDPAIFDRDAFCKWVIVVHGQYVTAMKNDVRCFRAW